MVWLLNVKLGAVQSTYYMVKSYRFKFPNFRIGPCGISAAYRAHFPPLIVRARVRIIPCGFRSIWCGNSAVNGAEIPHDRCISAAYCAISAGHSALPHVAVRKFRTVQFGNLRLYARQKQITPLNLLTHPKLPPAMSSLAKHDPPQSSHLTQDGFKNVYENPLQNTLSIQKLNDHSEVHQKWYRSHN